MCVGLSFSPVYIPILYTRNNTRHTLQIHCNPEQSKVCIDSEEINDELKPIPGVIPSQLNLRPADVPHQTQPETETENADSGLDE